MIGTEITGVLSFHYIVSQAEEGHMQRKAKPLRHPFIRWEGIVRDGDDVWNGETMAPSEARAGSNLRDQFFRQFHYRPPKGSATVWKKEKRPALATR